MRLLFTDLMIDTLYPDTESLDAFTFTLDGLGEKIQCKHCHQRQLDMDWFMMNTLYQSDLE
jgi:hypothetical protein